MLVRWMWHVMTVLLFVLAVSAYVWHARAHRDDQAVLERMQNTVRSFELAVKLRAATDPDDANEFGWPATIDPGWFEGSPPVNVLIPRGHPWVEIAAPSQADLSHPPTRVALNQGSAAFWYNPATGVVRARVPHMVSDRRAVDWYNAINGASVESLFDRGRGG